MAKRLRGFAVSWFFAPYLGSADLDFFKRIKNCDIHFDVVQVKRGAKSDEVLKFVGDATLQRYEVKTDHENPRTEATREDFRKAALELFQAQAHSYDFIVSHSNEVPSHAVALECKRLRPHLPWVAYFGDVVSTNPYVRLLASYPLHDRDCETEALTLEHADVIICNNEYQKRLMFQGPMEKFASKAVVIPHCFEPAMFSMKPRPANDRFTFMHVGTLYHVRRTAAPLLKAVDRLLEIYPRYERQFEVVFYGGGYYQEDLVAHASMRHRSHARLEGKVGYLESLELMRTADVLVNIDGLFTEAEDELSFNPFFPGKLTDYMGARRPIMSITMDKGPTADIAAASGNLIADGRLDRIAYVMKRYLDGKVNWNVDAFARYEASVVGAEMEAVFRAAVAGAEALSELPGVLRDRRMALAPGPEPKLLEPQPVDLPRLPAVTDGPAARKKAGATKPRSAAKSPRRRSAR